MKNLIISVVIVSMISILHIGCSKSDGDSPAQSEEQYSKLIAQAKYLYINKNYASSLDLFKQAEGINNSRADAYMGAGWSMIRLNKLDEALAELSNGLLQDSKNPDILAGFAFILNAQKDFTQSNQKADLVLTLNPAWIFSMDIKVDRYTLYLLKAQNYFRMGDITNSYNQVKLLNPVFYMDTYYSSGRAELAAEIERLSKIIYN